MKTVVFEKGKKMKHRVMAVAAGAALVVSTALPVLASESGSTASMEEAVISSVSAAGVSMTNMVNAIIPIVLPIIAGIIVVKFGIRIFQTITARAH